MRIPQRERERRRAGKKGKPPRLLQREEITRIEG